MVDIGQAPSAKLKNYLVARGKACASPRGSFALVAWAYSAVTSRGQSACSGNATAEHEHEYVYGNLAEGCGRVSRRQRRYHFGVARGSATECAALADVLRRRRLTPASECFRARSLAVRCVQMLTKLVGSSA